MIRFAVILLLGAVTISPAFADEPFSKLWRMREDPYPQVFFFRSSEKIGRSGTVGYQAWGRDFSRLPFALINGSGHQLWSAAYINVCVRGGLIQ
jgi:hypothetical protein